MKKKSRQFQLPQFSALTLLCVGLSITSVFAEDAPSNSTSTPPAAKDQTYIAVGQAKTRKTSIALPSFIGSPPLKAAGEKTLEIVRADLMYMDSFQILDPKGFTDTSAGVEPGTFQMTNWSSVQAEFVFKASMKNTESGVALEGYLYNVGSGNAIVTKRYLASLGDLKTLGHTVANDIVKAISGLPGIFLTKIAMVCDRTSKKEIYVMDFDGSNNRQVTHHKSVTLSPAWSPDGTRIAYSLYAKNKRNIKNVNLYEFDFSSNRIKLLSDRLGINSGAHYHPDGKKIALTMSFLGNPEIFSFDPSSKSVTRLTNNAGVDVDPNWAPDGKHLSFVSNRAGAPMVYRMNSDGSDVRRLTFAGTYNATPSWSPQNNKIAFAGWLDRRFDIFVMNPDGTNIERLTKDQGNNEDPSFSPDGNFLVFSSNRAGQKNVYVMNIDGTFVKRMTYGLGDCVSPRWSNPSR
ncbi:MAG: Tol-Pal system beta propeller repeat protein TolB [Cryobacterium sp.]|nr:Tol-Pal system beta propeller repeat protein TolB [Oligoflexia bacterium]